MSNVYVVVQNPDEQLVMGTHTTEAPREVEVQVQVQEREPLEIEVRLYLWWRISLFMATIDSFVNIINILVFVDDIFFIHGVVGFFTIRAIQLCKIRYITVYQIMFFIYVLTFYTMYPFVIWSFIYACTLTYLEWLIRHSNSQDINELQHLSLG